MKYTPIVPYLAAAAAAAVCALAPPPAAARPRPAALSESDKNPAQQAPRSRTSTG